VFVSTEQTIALALSLRGGTEEVRQYLCGALFS